MRIALMAGGLWHQRGLAEGLRSLGHSVKAVGPPRSVIDNAVPLYRGWQRRVVSQLPDGQYCWSCVAGKRISNYISINLGEIDAVFGWSSFMLESADTLLAERKPTIIVRGSHHIATQLEILGEAGPSRRMVARETAEYSRFGLVTVPTDEIAADQAWDERTHLVVSAYGFPVVEAVTPIGKPAGRRLLALVVGEVGYRKGFDLVVSALGGSNIDVEFLGRARLSKSQMQSLPRNFRLRGQVSARAVREAMSRADVLLSLSREEGMQRAGMEALACGCPVVASDASGLSRWLTAGGGIAVDRHAHSAIRDSIEEVGRNWVRYRQQALAVSRSWTWQDHARVLLDSLGSK